MKKYIASFAVVLLLCCSTKAQNYNVGPAHVNGAVYDASAASGSTLATNSSLLVGSGGTWLLNATRFSTPRTSTSQTAIIKFSGGVYTRITGYVNGYVAADNQAAGFVMPIGQSSYMPLTVNAALAPGSPIIAAWYDGQPSASTYIAGELYYFLPGYYELETTGAGVSVTPTTAPAAIAGTRLLGSADGTNFVDLGAAGATVALPSGSYQFRFANSSTVLPLTLTTFTATRQNLTGLLSWKISAEQNVQSYTVERSADGRRFTAIGTLPSLGNATQERTYALPDAAPFKGANYYRLKITGKGGKIDYSATRLLNFDAVIRIAVYPNPVITTASVTGLEAGMQVTIMSMQGQQLISQKASGNTMEINMKPLPAGVYQVQVQGATGPLVAGYRIAKE